MINFLGYHVPCSVECQSGRVFLPQPKRYKVGMKKDQEIEILTREVQTEDQSTGGYEGKHELLLIKRIGDTIIPSGDHGYPNYIHTIHPLGVFNTRPEAEAYGAGWLRNSKHNTIDGYRHPTFTGSSGGSGDFDLDDSSPHYDLRKDQK